MLWKKSMINIQCNTSNGNEPTDVYIRGNTINIRITNVTEFNKFTAAVFGEFSGNVAESAAIAQVIRNRANYTGRRVVRKLRRIHYREL